MEPKAGWKTTEFWLTLIPVLTGAALIIIGAVTSNEVLVGIGSGLIGGAPAAYGVSRAVTKVGTARAE